MTRQACIAKWCIQGQKKRTIGNTADEVTLQYLQNALIRHIEGTALS
jgi:hypothetical protein